MKCNQQDCDNVAAFRFTWPGRDEAGICTKHVAKLRSMVNTLRMHLQLIPVVDDKQGEKQ